MTETPERAQTPEKAETSETSETSENRRSLPVVGPGGRKYRVVAAKKGLPYRDVAGDIVSDDLNPISWVIGWVISGLLNLVINGSLNLRARDSTSWKVGVIRVGRFREKFIRKELLAPGVDPDQHMGELVDSITLGQLV
jgi:hypothetical protein